MSESQHDSFRRDKIAFPIQLKHTSIAPMRASSHQMLHISRNRCAPAPGMVDIMRGPLPWRVQLG